MCFQELVCVLIAVDEEIGDRRIQDILYIHLGPRVCNGIPSCITSEPMGLDNLDFEMSRSHVVLDAYPVPRVGSLYSATSLGGYQPPIHLDFMTSGERHVKSFVC